jgi:hypothetical protein
VLWTYSQYVFLLFSTPKATLNNDLCLVFASGTFIPSIPEIAHDLGTTDSIISFAVSLSIFGGFLGSVCGASYSGYCRPAFASPTQPSFLMFMRLLSNRRPPPNIPHIPAYLLPQLLWHSGISRCPLTHVLPLHAISRLVSWHGSWCGCYRRSIQARRAWNCNGSILCSEFPPLISMYTCKLRWIVCCIGFFTRSGARSTNWWCSDRVPLLAYPASWAWDIRRCRLCRYVPLLS